MNVFFFLRGEGDIVGKEDEDGRCGAAHGGQSIMQ